jgi:hypothetical protein
MQDCQLVAERNDLAPILRGCKTDQRAMKEVPS